MPASQRRAAQPLASRRRWLATAAGGAALGLSSWARLAFSAPAPMAATNAPRLVLVLLRGGMDGLSAVPVPGDPGFEPARSLLAQLPRPALPLDGPFALHPALARLHALYGQGELAVLHAVGQSYRERSHFDAQQVLESGGEHPFALDSGWLGRALAGAGQRGMAFQPAVPLALRGPGEIDTWTPSGRADTGSGELSDLLQRVGRLYDGDALLAPAFERARRLHQQGAAGVGAGMSSGVSSGMGAGMGAGSAAGMDMGMAPMAGAAGGPAARWAALGRHAAGFLAAPHGPQAAMLEMGGWDSHANQAAPMSDAAPLAYGALGNNLLALDALLGALCDGLAQPASGPAVWPRTLVLVVTEFGRTVAMNGTQGTDHGSGGAAFALGGAVAGGRVLADWPGLAPAQRFEGRDLRTTTDLRSLFKTALHQHLGLPLARIHRELLPGSEALPLLPLLRA